jgi:hypothetical protein
MLLIAIAYGNGCDPFTTSSTLTFEKATQLGLDLDNANQMRDYICQDKKISSIDSKVIDEILIIYPSDFDEEIQEPKIQHHHTEFD